MQKVLFIIFFLTSFAHASTINLNIGDSITLQANSTTTVTCSGENSICKLPVQNLKLKFDYCKSSQNGDVEACINQLWPAFKQVNGVCISEAFSTCLTFCKSSMYPTLDCLPLCD